MILQLINKFKKNGLVFIISDRFDDLYFLSYLGNAHEYDSLMGFINYNHMFAAAKSGNEPQKKVMLDYIQLIMKKYHRRTVKPKELDEPVTILHLSDLHFGHKYEISRNLLSAQIKKTLEDYDIKPDILTITGDFTYTSKKSEYDLAKTNLIELCNLLFPYDKDNYHERIVLVPGNHDFNFRLSAGDFYDYQFPDDKNIKEPSLILKDPFKKKLNSVDSQKAYADDKSCSNLAMQFFREFAYELTKDINWLKDDFYKCNLNNIFLDWGIRFYQVNTSSRKDFYNYKSACVPLEIKGIIQEQWTLPQIRKNDVYNILVTHHGFNDLEYKLGNDNNTNQIWVDTSDLLETAQIDFWMFGHGHYNKAYSLPYCNGKTVLTSQSSTPRLSPAETGDNSRGFNVIRLIRTDGIVTGVKVFTFSITSDIKLVNEETFQRGQRI